MRIGLSHNIWNSGGSRFISYCCGSERRNRLFLASLLLLLNATGTGDQKDYTETEYRSFSYKKSLKYSSSALRPYRK